MSNLDLAPRPKNETRRAMAVVKTGLIDNPDPDLFQIYCDLAQDITGFKSATFSLYDGENQCSIAAIGKDQFFSGTKTNRDINNICTYVLLSHEPLIINDFREHEIWKSHPKVVSGESWLGYAGFPVINKDNYALGTLCMQNPEPMKISESKIKLVKKITQNIAHLLDLKTEQKELTAQKIFYALEVFHKIDYEFALKDFKNFLAICSEINIPWKSLKNLVKHNLCEIGQNGNVILTSDGRILQSKMKIETKIMKKIKLEGSDAKKLVDEMLSEIGTA